MVITCPTSNVIVERAVKVMIAPESDFKRIIVNFAQKVGGSEKVASGINMAWELAVWDVATQPGAVPLVGVLIGMEFDKIMGAVFAETPDFLNEVLTIRREIEAMSKS